MGTVASELKAEREKRKIPLADIAAETRISLRHLESLEEGRYGDMPGGIYNRAFLKAYCEFLNLNVPEIMQRYESEVLLPSDKSARSRVHVPQRSRSFSVSPLFAWGLMLVISAAGIYFSRKWIAAIFSPYFSHAPAAAVRYEMPQPPPTPKPSEIIAPAVEPPAPAMPSEGTTIAVQSPSTTPASSPAASAAEASLPAAPLKETNAAQAIQLEITAAEKCWVSIERDGISAFRRMMEPGDIQSFDAADRFLVVVGNAGGVQLKINGKPVKPLGKPGSVVKMLIDRRNLQDLLSGTVS